MARDPHDPIYVLGWIAFIGLVFVFVLGVMQRPVPAVLGGVVGSALTVLGQAAQSWIEAGRAGQRPKKPKRKGEG